MSSDISRGDGRTPDEGRGGAAPPIGGQTKRFVYPPLPPPFSFGGGVTPRDAATPTPEQPIVRQHEEISEIDHFLEQWRNDQNKAKEDAARSAALKPRLKPVK
ncbi:MAG: hypothetical protein H7145_21825 [Akkermansiaceae bacterium]|nr:hypothetical protein [Armatimonadota bacterium]